MIFLELVLQNFGPYLGRQVINLHAGVDESSRPIILFGGMNGGGKTTLMDAIRLALYGHRAQCSTRGSLSYGEFLTQSVNRQTRPYEEACIELAFQHIVNNLPEEYRIKRTWTRNPKGNKDSLGVLVDNWPDTALAKTWDERIEDFFPLGISNLFLFDGEQVKELAEMETPPDVVVEAIQSLLGLELAERLSADLDIVVNRKRKAIADAQSLASLEAIEEKLQQQREDLNEAKQELSSLQNKLTRAQEQHRLAHEKFLSEGGKIASERSQLEKQMRDLAAAAEQERQKMSELAADALPLALISHLLAQAKTQGEKEIRQQQALIARQLLKDRDSRLLDYINKLALLPEQVNKIKLFLSEENQHIDREAEGDEPWLLADAETINQLANILKYYLPNQLKLIREQLLNLKNQEEEITATERQLAVAASPETYEKLEKAVRDAQVNLTGAVHSYETGRRRCEERGLILDKILNELARYSEQNIDRKNDENIITASAKVQATLKVFREKLTLRKLNQLESEVTECFLYLLHKSDLVHRVAISINTFKISLYDTQGQVVPKHRLSAGEKQLLAIAFLWGLARVSGRNLPVAIDTPLGRLDSSHRQNLVERYFPAASHQVILLSTDTEIGKVEVERLRQHDALAREYLLKYSSESQQTVVEEGYFW